jgi:serine/threonine protein kinase/ABC-type phosphate/phosphonate transport system substrate-binding protein
MSTPSSSELFGATVCLVCQRALPPDQTPGFCPNCALKEALELGEKDNPSGTKASSRTLAGRQFGDYELMDQLGRGGMGVVYRAYQKSLKRIVALKMILDTKQNSPGAARRFQIEAEAAARLLHPNIVRLYEFGLEEEQPFFTMEWIDGESLSRRIARGDYLAGDIPNHPESRQRMVRAVELVVKIARAVQYAHERGVIHRDIKPANILTDQNGEPHLTDFGLAKLAKDTSTIVSDSGSVAGTPAYMAPEQARAERLSPAADIYSLGVVLYELLTGKPPFSAATPLETLRLITDHEPPDPSKVTGGRVDADLATICRKCLEKQPAARYGSAQEMADDLTRWLAHEPIRARPIGPTARLRRWIRRNPVGASFIAVLLLGLVTTTALIERLRESRQLVEEQRDRILENLMARIEDFWNQPEIATLPVRSQEIAALLQLPKAQSEFPGQPRQFRVSHTVPDSPMNQITRKGYGLAQMEKRLSVLLQRPVLLHLLLFKPQGGKVESLIRGDSDLKRMGGLPYLMAKQIKPGLIPLAKDSLPKQAAIFVRQDSGITNLAQLVGRSLALGDEDATISFQAKVELVHHGILGDHLARWEHLPRRSQSTDRNTSRPSLPSSHARAIMAVRAGDFDAGVARMEYVQDFTKHDLRIIHQFESHPNFWVASDELSPTEVAAMRQALTEKPVQISGGPWTEPMTRFVTIDDHSFDSIRQAMTNEVARFEGNRPVQSRLTTSPPKDDDDDE